MGPLMSAKELEQLCVDLAPKVVGNYEAMRFVLTYGSDETRQRVAHIALERVKNRHVGADERAQIAFVLMESDAMCGHGASLSVPSVSAVDAVVDSIKPKRGRPRKKG